MTVKDPTISLILPFYLQGAHMQSVIDDYKQSLDKFGETYEIIIIDNGVEGLESEETEEVVSAEPRIIRGKLRKKGWGLALRWAFARVRGKYICYTNSARTSGSDAMNLFRYAMLSEDAIVKAARPERARIRRWVSLFYNIENRVLLGTPVWDVNASPKIIPRKVLEKLTLTTSDDLFDAELLYQAYRNHVPIVEVPFLKWERKSGESSTNWLTAVRLFFGVWKLFFRSLWKGGINQ